MAHLRLVDDLRDDERRAPRVFRLVKSVRLARPPAGPALLWDLWDEEMQCTRLLHSVMAAVREDFGRAWQRRRLEALVFGKWDEDEDSFDDIAE